MLRGEGCSLPDDRGQRFSPSGLLSRCVQRCTTDVRRPVSGGRQQDALSPDVAVADTVAAFPVPLDDRIAYRELLNLKPMGAEEGQRSNPTKLSLLCTTVQSILCCIPPPHMSNISDNHCISLRPHTYVSYQCSTASLLPDFHSRSHVTYVPIYYDTKYSSYQGLTASSSLVYRGAVYHENLSYR